MQGGTGINISFTVDLFWFFKMKDKGNLRFKYYFRFPLRNENACLCRLSVKCHVEKVNTQTLFPLLEFSSILVGGQY